MNYSRNLKDFTVFNVYDLIKLRKHIEYFRGIPVDDFFYNFIQKGEAYLVILECADGSYKYFVTETVQKAYEDGRPANTTIHMKSVYSKGKMLCNTESSKEWGNYSSYVISLSKEEYEREKVDSCSLTLEEIAVSLLVKVLGGVNK